jgi:signal transduction histidine kinase
LDSLSDQVHDLRACVRDLAALSSLSLAWSRADLLGVAESLAVILTRVLSADLLYVRLTNLAGGPDVEIARSSQGPVEPDQASAIGDAVRTLAAADDISDPAPGIPNPFGGGTVHLAIFQLGYAGESGTLVAGSRRPNFPGQTERLLLSVSANQAAVSLQQKRSEQALKEADRRKDEFLATLAHELRNPLAPLGSALEILRLTGPDSPALNRLRDIMDRQLKQMVRLVDDLLDVSRITRDKIELRSESVDLATVAESALETSRPLMVESQHEITVNLPPDPLVVIGDHTRLVQVVSNLLNNSAKYTPERGKISLSLTRDGEDAVIRVLDNGMGMPVTLLPRVFDMFAQGGETGAHAHGGLGIGLTLVKRLISMHGGTVEAYSEGPGYGSEFVVRLPAAADLAQFPPNLRVRAETGSPWPPLRILLADDNVDAIESLSMLLELLGNEVYTVPDGSSALELAMKLGPDVILLDIGLPDINGYEVARRIREQHGKSVVLVALTGWGAGEDKRRSREAGFDFHLVKPVDWAVLQDVLAQAHQAVKVTG